MMSGVLKHHFIDSKVFHRENFSNATPVYGDGKSEKESLANARVSARQQLRV